MGYRQSLLPILLGLLLSGCASGPETAQKTSTTTAAPSLVEIVEARGYLETAQYLGNEWRVSHPLTGGSAMGLGDMLALSEDAADRGDQDRAREIALLVSAYSRLAISQSRSNSYVRPRYPQN